MEEEAVGLVQYESAYGHVKLSADTVINYLAKGKTKLTEQEAVLFVQLCKYQQLNPFVGEAYAVKFNDDFQMIVGYDTYKRRAEENPDYRGKSSGIVVKRGSEYIKKRGCCVYPGESLIGGWCSVMREINGKEVEEYREVSLAEYDRNMANWKTKPATMIEKVAVSQCLRNAFPKNFAGLYTEDEMPSAQEMDGSDFEKKPEAHANDVPEPASDVVTQQERRAMYDMAKIAWGSESVDAIKTLCQERNIANTKEMNHAQYAEIMAIINEAVDQQEVSMQNAEQPDDYEVH